MNGLVAFALLTVLGFVVLGRAVRDEGPEIKRLAAFGLAAHLVAAIAQIWITSGVYGAGDMLGYHVQGVELARLLGYDFGLFAPEVVNVVFQRPALLPVPVIGVGTPTGTMAGIAAFLVYVVGTSLYGVAATIAVGAFFGKLALHRALAADADASLRVPLFYAVVLVPSVVYWSAGLLKESVIIGPLGFLYASFRALVVERTPRALVPLAICAVIVALIKPYILFACLAGAGAFLYGESARRAGRAAVIRPVPLAITASVAVGGVIGLGELFPEYALDQIAEAAAHEQAVGQRFQGGSSYTIGDPLARSVGGQLAFAPIAIVSSLFRPFPFEVRNAQLFVSALESTTVLLLFARAVLRRSWAAVWRDLTRSPMLMFCATFALTFGLPVGLATTNLGTLSRYRMPLLPFFVAALAVWNADLVRGRGEAWRGRS